MVAVAPAASDEIVHGTPLVQAPEVELKRMPGGVGSVTTTFVAGLGPRFVTAIVKVACVAALTCAGPVLMIRRSAFGAATVTAVVTVDESFDAFPSKVEVLTFARVVR